MSNSIVLLTTSRSAAAAAGRRFAATLGLWAARARQRRALAELPDERLRDLGLTWAMALAEARKPFWRR